MFGKIIQTDQMTPTVIVNGTLTSFKMLRVHSSSLLGCSRNLIINISLLTHILFSYTKISLNL